MAAHLHVGICCVDYDDFLQLTLPHNVFSLASITIITAPWDRNTAEIAEQAGARVLVTDAWKSGGPFNKARALNQWIRELGPSFPQDTWLLSLDADILLPNRGGLPFADLDPTCLYGAKRRLCPDQRAFQEYTNGRRHLLSFALDVPEVRNGMVWGHRPTSNPAALQGYFQLWCPSLAAGASSFDETGTAAKYDVEFGLSFPSTSRKYLESFEVLHLGPVKTNWAGRASSRWT